MNLFKIEADANNYTREEMIEICKEFVIKQTGKLEPEISLNINGIKLSLFGGLVIFDGILTDKLKFNAIVNHLEKEGFFIKNKFILAF